MDLGGALATATHRGADRCLVVCAIDLSTDSRRDRKDRHQYPVRDPRRVSADLSTRWSWRTCSRSESGPGAMTVVLGFEGTVDGALVSYGAAAIAAGDKHVRNSL